MSRKPPSDTFTRFTSTSPSTSSQPSQSTFTSSTPSSSSATQETPQQRVARLRADHLRRRAAELSTTDRVLSYGRRSADIAHRLTTYTLLGFSAAATAVAAYGLVSLVSHNRTQKRAWIEREMDRLEAARASFLKGEADAEQLHLLEQERAGEEIKKRYEEDKRRRKEEGWFNSVKGLFGAGKGDMGRDGGERTLKERGDALREGEREFERRVEGEPGALRPAAVAESGVKGVGLDDKGRPVPMGKMVRTGESPIVDAVRQQVEERRGGQLDMLAENIVGDAKAAGSGWWTSIFGGSRS